MPYDGSCHCGAVAFSVAAEASGTAISCNCSLCRRKGLLLTFVPRSAMTLHSGADALRTYLFNTHRIRHQFCGTCGTQPFAYGTAPDGTETCAINLRCVPVVDPDSLDIQRFDGASR